jgi:hypothetical protein
MNKQERTYLEMELEEPRLESGRYNTDFGLTNQAQSASPLLGLFRKLTQGSDFNLPALSGLGTAKFGN